MFIYVLIISRIYSYNLITLINKNLVPTGLYTPDNTVKVIQHNSITEKALIMCIRLLDKHSSPTD